MIAPQPAKPYVKRNKNDAADAEGLCEAMSRPTMRFVPVKTVDENDGMLASAIGNVPARQLDDSSEL